MTARGAEQLNGGDPANAAAALRTPGPCPLAAATAGGERYLRRKHLGGCTSSSFQLGDERGGTEGLGVGWRDGEEEGEQERGGEREDEMLREVMLMEEMEEGSGPPGWDGRGGCSPSPVSSRLFTGKPSPGRCCRREKPPQAHTHLGDGTGSRSPSAPHLQPHGSAHPHATPDLPQPRLQRHGGN